MVYSKRIFIELVIFIVSIVSILLNFCLFKDWRGLFYYTILSNLLVMFFYGLSLIKRIKGSLNENINYYVIKGLVLISIVCTMFIYNFFIFEDNNIYANSPFVSNIAHIIVPIIVMLDFIFYNRSEVFKYKYIVFWEAPLILYYFFINIYSILGGEFLNGKKYPYDLINFEIYSNFRVFLNCLIILIFYTLIGFCVVFINRNKKFNLGGNKKI